MAKIDVDSAALVKRLLDEKERTQRKKIMLFLSESLYRDFKVACTERDLTMSDTLEALLRGFLDGLERSKRP